MKWSYIAILFVLALLNPPSPRQDGPSEYDKCRIVLSSDLYDKEAPTFASYHAVAPEVIANAKLDLKSNPIARMYRTVLQGKIAEGPNFAGHYRVAVWGCGSSCAQFAVINLRTGRVITLKGFSSTSLVYFDNDRDFLPGTESDDLGFRYRSDSKMLVVIGDINEDESREGAFYLVIEGGRLRLIHSTIVKKDCEKLRRPH